MNKLLIKLLQYLTRKMVNKKLIDLGTMAIQKLLQKYPSLVDSQLKVKAINKINKKGPITIYLQLRNFRYTLNLELTFKVNPQNNLVQLDTLYEGIHFQHLTTFSRQQILQDFDLWKVDLNLVLSNLVDPLFKNNTEECLT